MPSIFHLSDLHFGPRFNQHLADLVLQDIRAVQPDLVIVSGDWTMRGRISEYEQARDYLNKLPPPVFTIPGNHDQPLHPGGLWERLVRPWGRYKTFIRPETDSVWQGKGLFVIGLNDNHNVIPGGIWQPGQVAWMNRELEAAPPAACKILVMHHHLLWNGKLRPAGQYFPTKTLNRLAGHGVELVLNGHTHVPITRETAQGIVIAQSGTTMSGRTRHGHGNTFNRIDVGHDSIDVAICAYDSTEDRFLVTSRTAFARKHKVVQ
ncbi:MAG: metallophosphoesterase [Anaerolineae bacterium]